MMNIRKHRNTFKTTEKTVITYKTFLTLFSKREENKEELQGSEWRMIFENEDEPQEEWRREKMKNESENVKKSFHWLSLGGYKNVC